MLECPLLPICSGARSSHVAKKLTHMVANQPRRIFGNKKWAIVELEETCVNGKIVLKLQFSQRSKLAWHLFRILAVCDNDHKSGFCGNVFSFGKVYSQPQIKDRVIIQNIFKKSFRCSNFCALHHVFHAVVLQFLE